MLPKIIIVPLVFHSSPLLALNFSCAVNNQVWNTYMQFRLLLYEKHLMPPSEKHCGDTKFIDGARNFCIVARCKPFQPRSNISTRFSNGLYYVGAVSVNFVRLPGS